MALRLKDEESKLFVYTSDTDFFDNSSPFGKMRRRNVLSSETKLLQRFASLGFSK